MAMKRHGIPARKAPPCMPPTWFGTPQNSFSSGLLSARQHVPVRFLSGEVALTLVVDFTHTVQMVESAILSVSGFVGKLVAPQARMSTDRVLTLMRSQSCHELLFIVISPHDSTST
jgi:hypothetical protein